MDNILIITQARINSKRFPKKILKKVFKKKMIEIHIERLLLSKYSKNLIVATTKEKEIFKLINLLEKKGIKYYQGSTEDVLDRFYHAAKSYNPKYIVRVTSDCPLVDPILIDKIINFTLKYNLDYVSNTLIESFPDGQDIEVIKWEAILEAHKNSLTKHEREHVTPYIRKHSSFYGEKKFNSRNYDCDKNYNSVRMTVDTKVDLEAINVLVNHLGIYSDWETYADFILENPKLFNNQEIKRNEGSQ